MRSGTFESACLISINLQQPYFETYFKGNPKTSYKNHNKFNEKLNSKIKKKEIEKLRLFKMSRYSLKPIRQISAY